MATRFLERVASKLGIDAGTLQSAIKDTRLEMVDEAVASGRITDEQAAKARGRIDQGKTLGLRRHKHERHEKIRQEIIESAASAMSMTPDELKAELKSGKSIVDVAAEKGISLDDVKTAIIASAKEKLDGAVAKGRIDQQRADALLQRLQDRLDTLLNKSREVPATPTQ
jgi:hypothetical protein